MLSLTATLKIWIRLRRSPPELRIEYKCAQRSRRRVNLVQKNPKAITASPKERQVSRLNEVTVQETTLEQTMLSTLMRAEGLHNIVSGDHNRDQMSGIFQTRIVREIRDRNILAEGIRKTITCLALRATDKRTLFQGSRPT